MIDRMQLIRSAVKAQALDEGLWGETVHIAEACLQESLRDLHRVIEDGNMEAFQRIADRVMDL